MLEAIEAWVGDVPGEESELVEFPLAISWVDNNEEIWCQGRTIHLYVSLILMDENWITLEVLDVLKILFM